MLATFNYCHHCEGVSEYTLGWRPHVPYRAGQDGGAVQALREPQRGDRLSLDKSRHCCKVITFSPQFAIKKKLLSLFYKNICLKFGMLHIYRKVALQNIIEFK